MIVRPKCSLVHWSKSVYNIGQISRIKLKLIRKAVNSLRKKIVQTVLPKKSKTVWTIQRTSNKKFLSTIGAKIYTCNSAQKKNRAMFSSYHVKMFGDYQPIFRAKWEQKIEFVFFPRKKSFTVFSSSGLKQFAKNQPFFSSIVWVDILGFIFSP